MVLYYFFTVRLAEFFQREGRSREDEFLDYVNFDARLLALGDAFHAIELPGARLIHANDLSAAYLANGLESDGPGASHSIHGHRAFASFVHIVVVVQKLNTVA